MQTAALLLLLAAQEEPLDFEIRYLPVHGRRIDTLLADFNGDGREDLLNTSIDQDQDPPRRLLALHLQGEEGHPIEPSRLWDPGPRAAALVFGDFLPRGGVEAGFLAEDGVYVFPADETAPVKLLHVATFFRAAAPRRLPLWSTPVDFDGDGRHDLIVPLPDGYRVYFQTAPGIFGRAATLEEDLPEGTPRALRAIRFAEQPPLAASHFSAGTELPKVEAVDIDGNGLKDIVVTRGGTMTYFLQKEPGVFPSRRPFRVSYAVPALRGGARKDTVNLALVRFVDIDRDGLADLVVTKIEGRLGLWDSIKTSIYIHRGTGRGNFVADRRIVIDGVSMVPEFVDMNLDGRLDAVTSRLRTDLMKQAVSALVLGDVAVSYEVFQFDPATEAFRPEPVYEKRILVPRRDLEKLDAGAVPLAFIRGDLSGDGRPDLVVVDPATGELLIHPGRDGPLIGFDGTAHWKVKLLRHPNGLEVRDVNGDGLNDLVLHHAGAVGLVLARRR